VLVVLVLLLDQILYLAQSHLLVVGMAVITMVAMELLVALVAAVRVAFLLSLAQVVLGILLQPHHLKVAMEAMVQ
jgi:hypothetical protein